MASHSYRICVSDSSSSRQRSQVGSSVNSNLKRYPFRLQCPVNSPTTHLNWSLFNVNRPFILLAEEPGISPFACQSPVTDLQIPNVFCDFCSPSPWPLSCQLQLICLKPVQVLWMMFRSRSCPTDVPFHYQQCPHDVAPISVELCYAWPVVWGIDGSPRPVLK
jgi:hypothetical protein